MKQRKVRIISTLLVIMLLSVMFALPVSADNQQEGTPALPNSEFELVNSENSNQYNEYKNNVLANYNIAKEDIVIAAKDYYKELDANGKPYSDDSSVTIEQDKIVTDTTIGSEQYDNKDVVVWNANSEGKQVGHLTYKITVPETAIYSIKLNYAAIDNNKCNKMVLAFYVDGEVPFAGLSNVEMNRVYKDDLDVLGQFQTDSLGNQLTPNQVVYTDYVTDFVKDKIGIENNPFEILLTAGEHYFTVESLFEPIKLNEIVLAVPARESSYKEYSSSYSDVQTSAKDVIMVEGEAAWLKSTNSLISKSDNSSSDVSPANPNKSLMNYIGNTNWKTPGQTITWKIYVPETGMYKLGMHYKQNGVIDGYSYRSLAIDGEVPFEEAKSLKFYYCTSWNFTEFGDDNDDPYYFYLTAGYHDISMTASMGETSDFYRRLEEISTAIGDMYIDIVMITSDSPDPNRDYDLFKQVPDYSERMQDMYVDITSLVEDMNALSGSRSTQYTSALNNMARVLKSMIDNQYSAQNYVTDYYSNYTTVCSWLYEMKSMPLSLDLMQFAPQGKDFVDTESSWLSSVKFSVVRFFLSFSSDFDTIAGSSDGDNGEVRIWINWGRDQAQVLSNLIQGDFSGKTGVNVKLELVNASLVKGILSGNYPDLSLHLSRTEPINLAMRGALYDLTNFTAENGFTAKELSEDPNTDYKMDYRDALKRFQETASTPYWYNDGLYALPDTQSFLIMFYRTDIFEELELTVPKTWKDFLDCGTILQRNNIDVYVPYVKIANTTVVNAGMGSLNLFPTFLAQNNVDLYSDEAVTTNLRTGGAINAFTQWTDLYTKYGVQKEINFYNRFRVGTVALGIATYTQYTQLTDAAPEIQGRWSIAVIPGIEQEDGTINSQVAGAGTGCGIIDKSDSKTQAWQFLCWWTSEEIQLAYNNNVESIIGAISRTATANINAFKNYSWNVDDLDILLDQWNNVKELEELPGGYYVSRAVDQAFWATVNGTSNEKDALLEWGKVANDEIDRKYKEYNKK